MQKHVSIEENGPMGEVRSRWGELKSPINIKKPKRRCQYLGNLGNHPTFKGLPIFTSLFLLDYSQKKTQSLTKVSSCCDYFFWYLKPIHWSWLLVRSPFRLNEFQVQFLLSNFQHCGWKNTTFVGSLPQFCWLNPCPYWSTHYFDCSNLRLVGG